MSEAEILLVTFALVGAALGAAAGAASALAGLAPAKYFAAALALQLAALAVPDLGLVLGPGERVAAIVIAPLLVFVPPAAGFLAARRLIEAVRPPPAGPSAS